MTRDEIRNATPEQLRMWVAERVMGEKIQGEYLLLITPSGARVLNYPGNWSAAGRVVEKMRGNGYGMEIKDSIVGWYCRMFTRPDESVDTWAFGYTLPEAVCRASLAVINES